MLNQRMPISDAQKLTGTETLVYLDQINLRSYVASAITKTATQLNLTAKGQARSYDLTQEGTCNIPVSVITP